MKFNGSIIYMIIAFITSQIIEEHTVFQGTREMQIKLKS